MSPGTEIDLRDINHVAERDVEARRRRSPPPHVVIAPAPCELEVSGRTAPAGGAPDDDQLELLNERRLDRVDVVATAVARLAAEQREGSPDVTSVAGAIDVELSQHVQRVL